MQQDIAAEAARLADALEATLEKHGKLLMRYVPVGMSCSLGYAVEYFEAGEYRPTSITRKVTFVTHRKAR